LLRILEREFEYYKGSFDSVGTQAALIAGFIVAVLVTLNTSHDARAASDLTPSTLPPYVVEAYHLMVGLYSLSAFSTSLFVPSPQCCPQRLDFSFLPPIKLANPIFIRRSRRSWH